jgi:hypothetical protein
MILEVVMVAMPDVAGGAACGGATPACYGQPVRFQNSAARLDLGFYAVRSYSSRRPPSTGRRLICFWER